MKLAWGNKVSKEFRQKVLDICKEFNWTGEYASWLMACIAFETAETFNPSIQNRAGSGATGLIQFLPSTAKGLGTTTDKLKFMGDVEQLSYVRDYLKPYYQRINSLSDMYMAILAPIAVGRSDDKPLYSSGAAYRMNAPLDINNDGVITKGEASRFVTAKLEKGMAYGNWIEVPWEEGKEEAIKLINDIALLLLRLKNLIEN